jgi:hypothetical protein
LHCALPTLSAISLGVHHRPGGDTAVGCRHRDRRPVQHDWICGPQHVRCISHSGQGERVLRRSMAFGRVHSSSAVSLRAAAFVGGCALGDSTSEIPDCPPDPRNTQCAAQCIGRISSDRGLVRATFSPASSPACIRLAGHGRWPRPRPEHLGLGDSRIRLVAASPPPRGRRDRVGGPQRADPHLC